MNRQRAVTVETESSKEKKKTVDPASSTTLLTLISTLCTSDLPILCLYYAKMHHNASPPIVHIQDQVGQDPSPWPGPP